MNEQNAEAARMPLIGEPAPAFQADTTHGPIDFPKEYKGSWVVFFSHPADFTPVCTTEFMTFASMAGDFEKLNTKLLGLSIDSTFSHIAWVRRIEERVEYKGMKNVKIPFPIVADLTMEVARKYGMLQPGASSIHTVRAVFVIDPKGIVRAVLYYPLDNGRSIPEVKRLVQAMQHSDEHGVATPANWQPGEDVIVPPPKSADMAADRVASPAEDCCCIDWFLTVKKCPHGE